ncbi:MAG: agmatinase [Hyphomicrobiaceae bacterium]|nr:agmatinase [Hyphomicrobiaceae bacterium]
MTDKSELARLRARYAGDNATTIHEPDYARVAAGVFTGDRRVWPFAGVPTLLGATYRPQPSCGDLDLRGLNIALVGVPMDLGVTNRAGARLGPRAVRGVERIGPWDHVLRRAPLQEVSVADIGDVPFRSRFDLAQCHQDIESHVAAIAAQGVVPLSVGGDHSISYAILRALGHNRPVGMVHIDAHCDTGGVFEGSKFHHGGPFRQAVLDGVLDPKRTIQIGIRGGAGYLWEFSTDSGMTVIEAEQAVAMGMEAVIANARAVVGRGPVYISFDIDSVDPGFAPGTGTPEVGGLAPREVLAILRGLMGLDVIGADVVEVAPQYDATTNTAQIGAQVLFVQTCLAVDAVRRRGPSET